MNITIIQTTQIYAVCFKWTAFFEKTAVSIRENKIP